MVVLAGSFPIETDRNRRRAHMKGPIDMPPPPQIWQVAARRASPPLVCLIHSARLIPPSRMGDDGRRRALHLRSRLPVFTKVVHPLRLRPKIRRFYTRYNYL